MRVVLSFPSFTRQWSYKVFSDPCRDTITSVQGSSSKLILLHSFVAAQCTRASYPCTSVCIFRVAVSTNLKSHLLVVAHCALHSTAPQWVPPPPQTHLEWLSADRLHSCDNAAPNRQMLLCEGLQHTSKKRVRNL